MVKLTKTRMIGPQDMAVDSSREHGMLGTRFWMDALNLTVPFDLLAETKSRYR